jgi:hypothetical protein
MRFFLLDSIARGDDEIADELPEGASDGHGHDFPHSFDDVFSLA